MTIAPPSRLRARRALPQQLRQALRELPNPAPEAARLDELRQKLGIVAPSSEARTRPLLISDQRLKDRRLRRTVLALLFFPVAATAAVRAVVDLHQRTAHSTVATTGSAASLARSRTQRVAITGAPIATLAPTANLEEPAASEPPASAPSPAGLPRAALLGPHTDAGPRPTERDGSASIASEVDLLQRANAAVKADPAQALSLAAEHRRRFPSGNLAQEREVIAIKALLALGEQARAREALTHFQNNYPRSAHALELQHMLR
jgi:hypothetical protein